jgi:hypothetical protein
MGLFINIRMLSVAHIIEAAADLEGDAKIEVRWTPAVPGLCMERRQLTRAPLRPVRARCPAGARSRYARHRNYWLPLLLLPRTAWPIRLLLVDQGEP